MSDIEASFDLTEFTSSSRLLCAITTRSGRVLWANDTLSRAFGPEAGAVTDRPLIELLDPYDRSAAIREMTRLDQSGDEVVFVARLHPLAGGFQAELSCHVGTDGLLYVVGTERDARLPGSVAGGAATARPDDEVNRDHLTHAASRAAFEAALDAELDRCRRAGLPLSVALIDLDRFKHYNDTFGHLAGDQCLTTVASAILQRTARAGEVVGRFGGDEFLVLWPGVDAGRAVRNAESIRDAVRLLDLRIATDPMEISVSIGGITMVPLLSTTADHLVGAADRAMYAAKHSGGDAVRWVTDPDALPGSDDAPARTA